MPSVQQYQLIEKIINPKVGGKMESLVQSLPTNRYANIFKKRNDLKNFRL